eukprot:g19574.t1
MERTDGLYKRWEVVPSKFNVRTRVHEYGGACFAVKTPWLYFVNFSDQRIYQMHVGSNMPIPFSPAGTRFADMTVARGGLIAVAERHQADGTVVNFLAFVTGPDDPIITLASGKDFYSHPSLSNDGKQLTWVCWDHPNMPWDDTELWVADLKDGKLTHQQKLSGPGESLTQPKWTMNNELFYISDRTNFWNIYSWDGKTHKALFPKEADFADPDWVFGLSSYDRYSQSLLCTYSDKNGAHLVLRQLAGGADEQLAVVGCHFKQVRVSGRHAVFVAQDETRADRILLVDMVTKKVKEVASADQSMLDEGYLSTPKIITFRTTGGATSHGIFYPPKNKDFEGPAGSKPPLIVKSHGGPTSAASAAFHRKVQFWTSRGFALLDVNYRGSTGYGRKYRKELDGNWGVYDVDDCVKGAEYLAAQGLVDGNRLAITGGSAGGYTTLAALAFRNTFKVGASHYGVSELTSLAKDTHKFESRYLDKLIGKYPEEEHIYIERSPLNSAQNINCPVIFFQGLEDKIVPPSQAEVMVKALKDRGIPVKYVTYEGEQHGFRKAENIVHSVNTELQFYLDVFYPISKS